MMQQNRDRNGSPRNTRPYDLNRDVARTSALHNGYVAQYKSSEDFANGIYWTLTDPDYPSLAEQACRKAVTHYSESAIAKKYIDLYNKVTGRNA